MKLQFKLVESERQIAEKIGNALIPDARKHMQKAMDVIRRQLPPVIYSILVSSPEYSSILGGSLRYEFGIVNPSQKLEGLLNIWTKNVSVTYSPPSVISGGTIKSKLTIEMIKSDFSDVLGTNYAMVDDSQRGYSLPWLQWLLLDGSYTIVDNHQVMLGSNPRSRTGMAVMKKTPVSSWSVPKRFAGTINDNWITRSLDLSQDNILNLLTKVLQNAK